MLNETQNLPAVNYFTPVELVGIYRNFLQRRGENNVIWLRGICQQRQQQGQWSAFFDAQGGRTMCFQKTIVSIIRCLQPLINIFYL